MIFEASAGSLQEPTLERVLDIGLGEDLVEIGIIREPLDDIQREGVQVKDRSSASVKSTN